MKKFARVFAILCALTLTLTACSSGSNGDKKDSTEATNKKIGTAKDGDEMKIEKASMKLVNAKEKGKYKLVGTEELKKWIDAKEDMVIVDTMPAKSFKANRIPGAVNAELPITMDKVTPEQKDAYIKALGDKKDKKVVVYCGFVGCERSDVGAVIAQEAGFKNVYRQPGGIIAWMDAGYDVEKDK